MKFTPKTDEQLQEENKYSPLVEGVYDFEVISSEDSQSKAGNEMIVLELRVFDNKSNRTVTVKDWLLEKIAWKLKAFFVSVGKEDDYNKGHVIADNLVGACGKVELEIGTYTNKDGEEKKTNRVKSYKGDLKPKKPNQASSEELNEILDDDVPF